jgi:hypothetical protein
VPGIQPICAGRRGRAAGPAAYWQAGKQHRQPRASIVALLFSGVVPARHKRALNLEVGSRGRIEITECVLHTHARAWRNKQALRSSMGLTQNAGAGLVPHRPLTCVEVRRVLQPSQAVASLLVGAGRAVAAACPRHKVRGVERGGRGVASELAWTWQSEVRRSAALLHVGIVQQARDGLRAGQPWRHQQGVVSIVYMDILRRPRKQSKCRQWRPRRHSAWGQSW